MKKTYAAGIAAAALCAAAACALAAMPPKKPQTVEDALRNRLADAMNSAGSAMKRAADRL